MTTNKSPEEMAGEYALGAYTPLTYGGSPSYLIEHLSSAYLAGYQAAEAKHAAESIQLWLDIAALKAKHEAELKVAHDFGYDHGKDYEQYLRRCPGPRGQLLMDGREESFEEFMKGREGRNEKDSN